MPQRSNLELGLPQLRATDKGYELSLYDDRFPTSDEFKVATNRLSIAFPKMAKEFFVLLTEFAVKEKFTSKRLQDAVNHVIANFQYKELNISDIIKFDKRIRLYNHDEYQRMIDRKEARHEDFEVKIVNGEKLLDGSGRVLRVKKSDIINL